MYTHAQNDNSPAVKKRDVSMTKASLEKRTCPICQKPTEHNYRPFCSKRCADIDLGRWLADGYAISGHADAEEDGALPTLEQDRDKKSTEK